MKKPSNSNTKAEILKAYDELLKVLQDEKSQNTALRQEIEQKRKTVSNVVEQTKIKGGATQSIQHIRELLNHQLDKIEDGISKEQEKFEDLQKAISIEKETLENLYKVKAEAESLEALVITNRQAKENLDKEMNERKQALLEQIEETKLGWKREEEEYQYKIKIQRRNDEDAYKEKKAKLEKDLTDRKTEFEKSISDREKAVAEQEDEMVQLRKEVEGFEAKLVKAVATAEQSITDNLTKEFEYRQKLETKDLEAKLQLREQEIEGLKVKVQEQLNFINSLTSKTDNATQQVKDIALKAIENAGIRSLTLPGTDRKDEKGGE